jgi:hypothetical protein
VIDQWDLHENPTGATWESVVASREYDGVWTMPTITWGGEAAFNWWRVVSYRADAGELTVDDTAAQHNAASTSLVAPAVTAVGEDDLLVFLGSPNGSNTTAGYTEPAGMTTVDEVANSVWLAEQQLAAAGSTGTRTATISASLENHGALVALNEVIQDESPGLPSVASIPTIPSI